MVRLFAILLVMVAVTGCLSNGSSSPVSGSTLRPVSLSLGSFTTADSGISRFFIVSAHATVSDLRFCFKRLRLKKSITDVDDPSVDENIDLPLGEKVMASTGTTLGVVNVPADTYYRVEFDLEPACGGNSVVLMNDFGSFTSTETLKIKFDGVFVVDGTEILQLGVQDILNAANAYNGVGSVKTALESVSGTM